MEPIAVSKRDAQICDSEGGPRERYVPLKRRPQTSGTLQRCIKGGQRSKGIEVIKGFLA